MLERTPHNTKQAGETDITFTPEDLINILEEMKTGPHRTPAQREDIQKRIDELKESIAEKERRD